MEPRVEDRYRLSKTLPEFMKKTKKINFTSHFDTTHNEGYNKHDFFAFLRKIQTLRECSVQEFKK